MPHKCSNTSGAGASKAILCRHVLTNQIHYIVLDKIYQYETSQLFVWTFVNYSHQILFRQTQERESCQRNVWLVSTRVTDCINQMTGVSRNPRKTHSLNYKNPCGLSSSNSPGWQKVDIIIRRSCWVSAGLVWSIELWHVHWSRETCFHCPLTTLTVSHYSDTRSY